MKVSGGTQTTPQVSVILPVFNGSNTLQTALDSISRQSFSHFEVVIVDDGSEDNTADVAQTHARCDSRFRLIRLDHISLPGALNAGLATAQAPYIARMDADDIMLPHRPARQYEYFEAHDNVDLVTCRVEPFPADQVTDGFRRYIEWANRSLTHDEILADLHRESPMPHPSVMFRRATVMDIGGYREFDGPEDYDLWLRMARNGARFTRLSEVLLRWRVHEQSLSRSSGRYRTEAFRKLSWEFMLNRLRKLNINENISLRICGAGRSGRLLCRFLLEHNVRVAGFVDVDPSRVGGKVMGLPVGSVSSLGSLPENTFLLFNVGNWGAVEEFEKLMAGQGRIPVRDYLVVSS